MGDTGREHETGSLHWGLFARLVGVCYAVTFLSESSQMLGLLGSQGILSVAEFIAVGSAELTAPHRYLRLPTLFWLDASDGFIAAVPWIGAAASLLVIAGIGSRVSLLVCYALHLSTVIAGGDFFFYPWDFLLLETSVLALFIPSLHRLPSLRARARPPRVIEWAIYFLLFRLQFGMGVHKFFDATHEQWRDLTYIYHWYEWQPMPTGASYFAYHHLPMWMHRCMDAFTFVAEVPLPFLLFIPGRPRLIAALLMAAMHCGIALFGNYGTFQIVTVALCIACISDAQWQAAVDGVRRRLRRAPRTAAQAAPASAREGRARRSALRLDALVGSIVATTAIVCGGLYTARMMQPQGTTLLSNTRWLFAPEAEHSMGYLGTRLLRLTAPFFVSYPYGIFREAPPEPHRVGLVFDGSLDRTHWRTYPNRYNPVEPHNRRPQFFAPHQPRLDHLFIYEAGGFHFASINGINPYYGARPPLPFITQRLFERSPDVLALFAGDPFRDRRPALVRARTARYRFTTPSEHARSGDYWVRDLEQILGPVDTAAMVQQVASARAFARRALKQAIEVDERKRPSGPAPVLEYNANAWMPPWKFWLFAAPGYVPLLFVTLRRRYLVRSTRSTLQTNGG